MPTRILAIETSCDETAAAVVDDGRFIRANVIASQADLHRRYGGVFPEMASRAHVEAIAPVIDAAMTEAQASWDSLSAVAVTKGPGLPGSLVVGVNAAKGICLARDLPLIGVNHLEGHIYAHWLEADGGSETASLVRQLLHSESPFPLLALIVSGGHTELVLMRGHGQYRLLGHTVDDAAGEAFDKVARLLNLGYPGGPAIQKAAEFGNPQRFKFSPPRVSLEAKTVRATSNEYMFSFSGAKTHVLRLTQDYGDANGNRADPVPVSDIAASFQEAVTDWLVEKTARAAEAFGVKAVLVGGGVSANKRLRAKMSARLGATVSFPPLALCTDNAAMIGAAGYYAFARGVRDDLTLDVEPDLKLG
ncbi:MAG: tRNA (adenosine(37)-N6)-threonylcarbamoyltransferase complex transferase subunit TsaD [Thermoflexales bacterium]|nr:tRNA (adenosine(37)-N6)-threonylcarbamoyltransferase complex transferase subunit TsaD [Thermoflexales bacterium]MDW8351209.1 tRNA (adenosine(37)-N6)-threonylcarbamoyltransferase complex transferase subunit TsaD [Anaerolineae bacterium]